MMNMFASHGTRARQNPHRKVGNANAVSAGIDLTRVGILGESELLWIRCLANEREGAVDEYLRRKEEARKAASEAHKKLWSDTKEAKHDEFLRSQVAAEAEAERRREELDAFYFQQEEEERRLRMKQLELQHLKEDPRGRNVKHAMMLHDALKGRDEQIEFQRQKEDRRLEEEKRYLEEKQLKAWGEEAEERQRALLRRHKNMEEKAANLEAVIYQMHRRKEEVLEEQDRRAEVEREALEEKLENEEEARIRREKECENGLWNKEHARKAVTKHQRLDERIATFAVDEARRIKEEKYLDDLKKLVEEKRRKKQELIESRKQQGLEAYLREKILPSATFRTQDVFEKNGTNFVNAIADADDVRVRETKERLQQAKHVAPDTHRKAAVSANGFSTFEEEQEYLEEMRKLPEKVRAEEAAQAAQKRNEADRIAYIQKLQAEEKRKHDRMQVELERENARQRQRFMEEDDKRFMKYLKSQIPDDMPPILRAKALKMS